MSNEVTMFWRNIPSSVLIEPRVYKGSAWSGHVPFAFWLIDVLKPMRLVELGTWYGMSYLAFCQAIDTFGTGTQAFAVDTWQGDEHTGPIAAKALSSLRADHDPYYSGFSKLLQMRFSEALALFEDGSVDLLHIDGLHTYEAVKDDFESWLPKLSDSAVVLFHDTQVRESGFAVFRLWEELSERYPHFEFHHQHGLGVLGVGDNQPQELRDLFAAADVPEDAARVRQMFERIGTAVSATQRASELQQRLDALHTNSAVRVVMKAQRMIGSAEA